MPRTIETHTEHTVYGTLIWLILQRSDNFSGKKTTN